MNSRGISVKFEMATPMWSEADGNRKKRQLQIAPSYWEWNCSGGCGWNEEEGLENEFVLGVMGIISIDPNSPPILQTLTSPNDHSPSPPLVKGMGSSFQLVGVKTHRNPTAPSLETFGTQGSADVCG